MFRTLLHSSHHTQQHSKVLAGAWLFSLCVCVQEAGYNGIHFNQLAHSWVRDVRIINSDSAFYSWGMVFCTLSGLEIASGDRGYDNGHRGIWLERGQDNLIVNFNVTTMMYHDLSVSFYEHSTAFVNGTGKVNNGAMWCCVCLRWAAGHSTGAQHTQHTDA